MSFIETIELVGELAAFAALIAAVIITIMKLFEGQKCLLRSEMLRIYYRYLDVKEIPQYEFENFCYCYAAYDKLHGNSFIGKVNKEIHTWKVVR